MAHSASRPAPKRPQVLGKAVLRASEILGLNQAALAKVLGISASSVSRLLTGDFQLTEHSKEWEFATLLVRLYRGLDAIMASDETALRAWMRAPNTDLNAVPSDLVITTQGLVDTVEYVDAYRARV
jgi:transcriptional regulator with XRE-family HTH domain